MVCRAGQHFSRDRRREQYHAHHRQRPDQRDRYPKSTRCDPAVDRIHGFVGSDFYHFHGRLYWSVLWYWHPLFDRRIRIRFFSSFTDQYLYRSFVGLVCGLCILYVIVGIVSDFSLHPRMNIWIGLLAVIILIVAGGLAGLIPARQAARVNPIVAMRS